jgi:hypothetical protein
MCNLYWFMGKTIVSLIIPFTFASEGKYKVSLNKKVADVEITYIQSNEIYDKIKGIVSEGKSELIPDDPEGVVNVSKVVLELPFHFIRPVANEDAHSYVSGSINEICVTYLNRLREVIRFWTRKYWIRPISPQHLTIYEIKTYDDSGKGRKLFIFFEPPSQIYFPLSTKENKEVESQITETLGIHFCLPIRGLRIYNYFLLIISSNELRVYNGCNTLGAK